MKKQCYLLLLVMFICNFIPSLAETAKFQNHKSSDEVQSQSAFFDVRSSTKSNISFYTSNYGIFGLNVANGIGGVFWPRGSQNQYIFGGGLWFGAFKYSRDSAKYLKLVELTFDPNTGHSWMVPGCLADDYSGIKDSSKYRLYMSTNYDRNAGYPDTSEGGPVWPLWKRNSEDKPLERLFVSDVSHRNQSFFQGGPAFVSDEDFFSVYKDTDLSRYDTSLKNPGGIGFPLGLQYEQTIYSWSKEDFKNMLIISYKIINCSKDTLLNCWAAPMFDPDIARAASASTGATNDWIRYYEEDTSLNLCMAWSNTDKGEKGYDFGYVGITMLSTPQVDEHTNFLIHNSPLSNKERQIGLKTFRNWTMARDMKVMEERYNALAESVRYSAGTVPDDKRMLISTGPFNMRPGDTAFVSVLVAFAAPAIKADADGTTDDAANLVELVKKGTDFYWSGLLTGINDEENQLSKQGFYISDPTPNPADNQTILFIKNIEDSRISIELYNMTGYKMLEIPENIYSSGMNRFPINTENLPSGSYLIRLIINGQVEFKKLNIFK